MQRLRPKTDRADMFLECHMFQVSPGFSRAKAAQWKVTPVGICLFDLVHGCECVILTFANPWCSFSGCSEALQVLER